MRVKNVCVCLFHCVCNMWIIFNCLILLLLIIFYISDDFDQKLPEESETSDEEEARDNRLRVKQNHAVPSTSGFSAKKDNQPIDEAAAAPLPLGTLLTLPLPSLNTL